MSIRKALSMMMALAFAMSFVSVLPVTALAEGSPTVTIGLDNVSPGDTIWFGNGIAWRVLSSVSDSTLPASKAGEVLLISQDVLGTTKFNENASDGNQWAGSKAQAWCQSFLSSFAEDSPERKAIKRTQAAEKGNFTYNMQTYSPASLDDSFFFLSAKEACTYFSSDYDRRATGSASYWWLRSPSYSNGSTIGCYIDVAGKPTPWSIDRACGARPAFNLDPSAVLFASPAIGTKTTADGGIRSLEQFSSTEWKLTLQDSSRAFSVSVSKLSADEAGKVSIPYSGAKTGSNEYISVLLRSISGQYYYGTVHAVLPSGTAVFTLPDGLEEGEYLLQVFNEQWNYDKMSDVASAFAEVVLTVGGEQLPEAYSDSTGSYAIENGEATFERPSKTNVSNVKVPDTVTIGTLTVPVTKIGQNAFRNHQKKLTKVTIGKNVKEIGKNAFLKCTKLKTVSGGANLEIIGGSAFQNCTKLTKFTIGAKVKEIGKKAFNKCSSLKKITIKSKLLTAQTVGNSAFKGINASATIKVPKAVKKEYSKWLLKKGVKKTMKIK